MSYDTLRQSPDANFPEHWAAAKDIELVTSKIDEVHMAALEGRELHGVSTVAVSADSVELVNKALRARIIFVQDTDGNWSMNRSAQDASVKYMNDGAIRVRTWARRFVPGEPGLRTSQDFHVAAPGIHVPLGQPEVEVVDPFSKAGCAGMAKELDQLLRPRRSWFGLLLQR